MSKMKWSSVVSDPLLSQLPDYKKSVFEKALADSRAMGQPTEELYNQILVIGKQAIFNFLITHPKYQNYIEEMISLVHEISVNVVIQLIGNQTIRYPIEYIRKAYFYRFLDLSETLRLVSEHRRTRVRRRLTNNKVPIQQQLLKENMQCVLDQTDSELWEVLESITENNLELRIMQLRAQGMTEVEVGKQLKVDQSTVARTLSKLFERYQLYMRNLSEGL